MKILVEGLARSIQPLILLFVLVLFAVVRHFEIMMIAALAGL